jgi:putative CocE/NonD family hydrolase
MAPAVTAAYFRDAVIYPGNTLGLETMLSWVYQVEHQELPLYRVLRSMLAQRKIVARGAATLPLADADRRMVGRTVGFYRDWLAHEEPRDPWWDPVDFRSGRLQAPPSTFLGGWYDIFLPAQVDDFVAMRAAGREARMTIGPWTHVGPGGLATSVREALAWFDSHADATSRARSAVRLFVMGGRRWVEVPDWPPPADVQRWHLQPAGGLSTAPPVESTPDRFRFDPSDPTPGIGGPSLDFRNAGRKNQARREQRSDVLTYTSTPMERDMTVAGPLRVDLWFRSSLEHTDVSVRLLCGFGKRPFGQPQRRLSTRAPRRRGRRRGRDAAPARRHVAHRGHLSTRRASQAAGREWCPPSLCPQPGHRRADRPGKDDQSRGPGCVP